jgi:hypothetical protein
LQNEHTCSPSQSISWVAGIIMTGCVSSGSRRASGLFLPTEIRTDVGASLAANLAGEQRLEIGQADDPAICPRSWSSSGRTCNPSNRSGSSERPAPIGQKAQPPAAGRSLKTAQAVTSNRGAGSGPRSRARRFALAGFLFSPQARTKVQFNGVGRLRTYISFTHSVF